MKSRNLTRIGSKELVSFPQANIYDVPAKADTGADSSSVWATDIVEEDGVLAFKLFGPGSKYYTGETLTFKQYKIVRIKNSFGHSEWRYKVKMSSVIGGRTIKIEFTLADRSRNRYPVLIGRRTMHRRFVVDVSIDNTRSKDHTRRVLMLGSLPSPRVEELSASMNESIDNLKVDFATYDDFCIRMGDSFQITNIHDSTSLSRYDLIYFKTYYKSAELAAVFAEYAELNDINYIDQEVGRYRSRSKLSQYARLTRFGMPVPKSMVISYKNLPGSFEKFKEELGLPFILKDSAADRGKSNYLIKSKAEFDDIAEKAQAEKAYYVGQEYIENDEDLRVVVLGSETKFAIMRRRLDKDTHLNGSSGGERIFIEAADLPSSVGVIAEASASVMNRQVAGVDLVNNSNDGQWYVLEVNNSPQLASGSFIDHKASELGKFLVDFADK